jgi:hypothetical protein
MGQINWKSQDSINQEELERARENKINELKNACTLAIYEGFESSLVDDAGMNHQFGFNQHDQQNFDQQYLLVISGDNAGQDIDWKSKNLGVITLTEDDFKVVISEAKNHKLSNQQNYWQLESLVLNASTIEEINNITWLE